jgi:hypothetical protein
LLPLGLEPAAGSNVGLMPVTVSTPAGIDWLLTLHFGCWWRQRLCQLRVECCPRGDSSQWPVPITLPSSTLQGQVCIAKLPDSRAKVALASDPEQKFTLAAWATGTQRIQSILLGVPISHFEVNSTIESPSLRLCASAGLISNEVHAQSYCAGGRAKTVYCVLRALLNASDR